MNKQELISNIASSTGLSKIDVGLVLDHQADEARAAVNRGEEVVVHGIGKIKVVQRAARAGRNPKTGEAMQVPAKRAVKVSVAKALKDAA